MSDIVIGRGKLLKPHATRCPRDDMLVYVSEKGNVAGSVRIPTNSHDIDSGEPRKITHIPVILSLSKDLTYEE